MVKPVKTARAMANLADKWYAARTKRLAVQRDLNKLEEIERELKKALLESMIASKVGTIGGKLVEVTHEVEDKPSVEDWPKLWKHIIKTKEFYLIQRRVGEAAVKERWEEGVDIPGVVAFPVDKLSYSKK